MKERDYQQIVVDKIYNLLPGERLRDKIVVINDPNYIQGIPDLSVYYRVTAKWAMLEVKTSEKSPVRPNQQWYIDEWGQYIFTSFIYPENEEEVLRELQIYLTSGVGG